MTKEFGVEKLQPQLPEQFFDMCAPGAGLGLDACYSRLSGPPTVMWDVTNRCNLDCVHCYNQSGTAPPVGDLDEETAMQLAEQIRDVRPFVICMCGGEPLLRRDLEALVAYVRPVVQHVNMVTNGWLLTPQRLDSLRKVGIGSIQVSLDGASPLTHDNVRGMPGSWERAMKAIRLLVGEGMDPPVTLIPHRLNYREIEEWVDLCSGLGVTNLRLMPIVPIGRALHNNDMLELTAIERVEILATLHRMRPTHPEINIEWGDPLEHIYNFASPENPMRTFAIEIRSDAKLVVSTYLPLIVGDLRRHRLSEYWKAGLADIWRHPRVQEWCKPLRCLNDFSTQAPQPWSGTDLEFDLIDDDGPGKKEN